MYKVNSSIKRLLIASKLYQRGIDGSVPFEKGQCSIRSLRDLEGEIQPFNVADKIRAEAFNKKLEEEKAKWVSENKIPAKPCETCGAKKDNFPVSELLKKEFEKYSEEKKEALEKLLEFDLSDDKYRASLDVCQNAQKIWYKAIQDKNACEDMEKRDKMPAPSLGEFADFMEFIEDLNNAEKEKEKK